MSAIQSRAKGAILRVGDDFTVSGNPRIGWIRVCSYGRALLYATPAEADTYTKPIRTLTVPFDDPTAVGDTVSWNSLTLLVKKSVPIRLNGEMIGKILLLG